MFLNSPLSGWSIWLSFKMHADQTCRGSGHAWNSWRSRNWSSTDGCRGGRKLWACSWPAGSGPHSPTAHQHLEKHNSDSSNPHLNIAFGLYSLLVMYLRVYHCRLVYQSSSMLDGWMDGLTLLCVFNDSDFSCGAHWIDAGVSIAGVASLIRGLHVVEDQAAVGRNQDVTPIRTHRNTIPVKQITTKMLMFFLLLLLLSYTSLFWEIRVRLSTMIVIWTPSSFHHFSVVGSLGGKSRRETQTSLFSATFSISSWGIPRPERRCNSSTEF